jgi:hypothetical protein
MPVRIPDKVQHATDQTVNLIQDKVIDAFLTLRNALPFWDGQNMDVSAAAPSSIYADGVVPDALGRDPQGWVPLKRIGDLTPRDLWEDLRSPATAINPPGLVSDPDFDTTNGVWLFDDSSTELLYLISQMPHDYLPGTAVEPHVHWVQPAAGNVYWQLDYKWFNVGDLVPAAFTTLATSTGTYTYSAGNLHQQTSFGSVDGTDMKQSSTWIIKVSRVGGNGADTMVGDAGFLEFDIHYRHTDKIWLF